MPCAIRTMYPEGCAQTATRPVGNCAGRRAERMMHTIAKASLHADLSWKSMKIDVKSCRNGSQFGPWCALVSLRDSKITQKLPKAHPKGLQGDPRAPFGSPRGVPRETKIPSPQQHGGLWGHILCAPTTPRVPHRPIHCDRPAFLTPPHPSPPSQNHLKHLNQLKNIKKQ